MVPYAGLRRCEGECRKDPPSLGSITIRGATQKLRDSPPPAPAGLPHRARNRPNEESPGSGARTVTRHACRADRRLRRGDSTGVETEDEEGSIQETCERERNRSRMSKFQAGVLVILAVAVSSTLWNTQWEYFPNGRLRVNRWTGTRQTYQCHEVHSPALEKQLKELHNELSLAIAGYPIDLGEEFRRYRRPGMTDDEYLEDRASLDRYKGDGRVSGALDRIKTLRAASMQCTWG